MSDPLAGPASGVIAECTDRTGGVSSGPYATLNLADHVGDDPACVAENRTIVAARVGVPPGALAVMKAAHGRDWALADRGGTYPDVDILVTTDPSVALLALAADCATIGLADPRAGVTAAVHSGWRGVAADAAGAAVAAMVSVGAEPHRIAAQLGPAVCAGCYEVSAQVRAEVAQGAPAAASLTRTGRPAVDLRAGVSEQLRRRGVPEVVVSPICTMESADHFSHRRDGVTGRHGLAVRLAGAG